jgi:hypothetical protein
VKAQFRPGEIVRVSGTGEEAVVENICGPNEDGTGWTVTVRLSGPATHDSLTVLSENALEPTGLAHDDGGQRVPVGVLPATEEARDCIELRLFTEITDGIDAARIAAEIEEDLIELIGEATVSTEAERHWADPYNYELVVTILPRSRTAEALRRLAEAGEGGWLAYRDDGWRCDLWWSASRDPDAILIVPEVHAAEIVFVPWSSPARRPEEERPLVAVAVPDDESDDA